MKLTFILITIICLGAVAWSGEYIIIVNPNSTLSEASATDLKYVYIGKVKDIGGKTVAPANLASDDPVAQSFFNEIIGMSSVDYKSFWMAQQIRGGSTAPAVKKSVEAMIEFVKESANAIGYVPKGTATEGVKVLTVK